MFGSKLHAVLVAAAVVTACSGKGDVSLRLDAGIDSSGPKRPAGDNAAWLQQRSPLVSPKPSAAERFRDIDNLPPPLGAIGRLGSSYLKHDSPVHVVQFHPRGKLLVTAEKDNIVIIWDAKTMVPKWRFQGRSFALSPMSNLIAVARHKAVSVFSLESGKLLCEFAAMHISGGALAFSPDGTVLAAGHTVYSLPSRKSRHLAGRLSSTVRNVSFTSDGRRLITVGEHRVRMWDTASGLMLHQFTHPRWSPPSKPPDPNDGFDWDWGITAAVLSPTGASIYVSSGMKTTRNVTEWSLVTGKPIRSVRREVWNPGRGVHGARIVFMDLCHANQATFDTYARLWSVHTTSGRLLLKKCLREIDERITARALSPDGTLLAIGGDDLTLRLWHVPSGKLLAQLQTFAAEISTLAFSPDGSQLVVAAGATVTLWDTQTRKLINGGAHGRFLRIAVSPSGQLVATASNSSVHIWQARTGRLISEKTTLPSVPLDMMFADDSRLLVFYGSGVHRYGFVWIHLSQRGGPVRVDRIPLVKSKDPYIKVTDGRQMWTWTKAFSASTLLAGKRLAVTSQMASTQNTVFFNAGTGKYLKSLNHALMLLFTATDRRLLVGLEDAAVLRLHTWDGSIQWSLPLPNIFELKRHEISVTSSQRSPAIVIAPAAENIKKKSSNCKRPIYVWRRHGSRFVRRAGCQEGPRVSALTSHGRRGLFSTGHVDGSIRVWSLKQLKPIYIYRTPQSTPTALLFSPSGNRLYSLQSSGNVLIWPVSN